MDREAVIWTQLGTAPIKMGRINVTDTECRFNFDALYLDVGLPGLGLLHSPVIAGTNALVWQRTEHFPLFPELISLIPPKNEHNFQRKLILAYLAKLGISPAPGFDTDWEILMVAGHGGIGHLDVFPNDEKAKDWYSNREPAPFSRITGNFGVSLKDFLSWMDQDAEGLLGILGPTPSVGGSIPKLLLSIPESGWDGRVALPSIPGAKGRTDIILKLEQTTQYPGIIELEALGLRIHKLSGFEVPRYWMTEVAGLPALAIERFDRTATSRPVFTETLYSIMASGDATITNHYSSTYDRIGQAIDFSPFPVVSNHIESKEHLLKRLLLALLTGNGDLHLENLSIVESGGVRRFSPVYDPTPMRAFPIHNMMAPMSFGQYADYSSKDELVDFDNGIRRFAKALGIPKKKLGVLAEEALQATFSFADEVENLMLVQDQSKRLLIDETNKIRDKLVGLMSAL